MAEYLNWVRDLNDQYNLSSVAVKTKFDTCIEKILEWHLDREHPLHKKWVDSNFPKITGNLKDWTNWALKHDNYGVTLSNLQKECLRLSNKRFDVKAGFSPQQNRLQQNLLIAEVAKMFLIAVIKHRESQNMTEAAKWAEQVRQSKKEEAKSLIQEVPNDSEEKDTK